MQQNGLHMKYHYGMDDYQHGPWVKEKLMGKGAFGSVVLWKNEETDQMVCVKECHCMELSDRQKSQWKKECSIMLKLKHPNVVRGMLTPPELESGSPDIPVLALEYCKGGDLRKVLNRPENCCGLRELQVRAIARDISLAVEYLHGKHIVHRDLKPENIVMKPLSNNKYQYKLIDLGYAKDISAGSICKSFVGTEQYLAPELFVSASYPGQHYNCNVDYWCLGTTVFECIVGFRPFFHGIPAVQWLRHVAEKRPEQICGILNIDGDVVFSETIPLPNSLCRHSQQQFEHWLRLMLMYHPEHRGGGVTADGRPGCFQLLETILKGQVMNLYSVLTNQVFSYPVDATTQILDVMQTIQKDTRLPVQEQEILQESGAVLTEEKLAIHCCGHVEEENLFFLFPQTSVQFTYQKRPQPELVQFLVSQSRNRSVPYDILKRAYSHCVHYIIMQNGDYTKLQQAQKAINLHLMRKKTDLAKAKKDMMAMVIDLQARVNFFKQSIQMDLERLESQRNSGIHSQKMVNLWNKTSEIVSGFSQLAHDAHELNKESERLDMVILDNNKAPQNRARNEAHSATWEQRVMDLYDKFRKMPKDDRQSAHDNTDMIKCVVDFITENSRHMVELYTSIQKILECKSEVLKLLPRIFELHGRTQDAQDKVIAFQKQRQKDIWGLFSEVWKSVASQGNVGEFHPTSNSEAEVPTVAAPVVPNPPLSKSMGPPPVPVAVTNTSPANTSSLCNSSMIVERSFEESMNLRHESFSGLQKLQQTMTSIQATITNKTNVPDWSFLEQDDDDDMEMSGPS